MGLPIAPGKNNVGTTNRGSTDATTRQSTDTTPGSTDTGTKASNLGDAGDDWGEGEKLKYGIRLDFDDCEWENAINFHPSHTGTFGYLVFWSGSDGLNLKQDMVLVNPFSTNTTQQFTGVTHDSDGSFLPCVGVIKSFKFKGKPNDPILIDCYVGKDNAKNIHSTFSKPGGVSKMAVNLAWYIIACDGAGDGWYEAAYIQGFSNASANLAVMPDKEQSEGGHVKLNVAHSATRPKSTGGDTIDVRLYNFRFIVVPAKGKVVNLTFANSSLARTTLPWGVAGSE